MFNKIYELIIMMMIRVELQSNIHIVTVHILNIYIFTVRRPKIIILMIVVVVWRLEFIYFKNNSFIFRIKKKEKKNLNL